MSKTDKFRRLGDFPKIYDRNSTLVNFIGLYSYRLVTKWRRLSIILSVILYVTVFQPQYYGWLLLLGSERIKELLRAGQPDSQTDKTDRQTYGMKVNVTLPVSMEEK